MEYFILVTFGIFVWGWMGIASTKFWWLTRFRGTKWEKDLPLSPVLRVLLGPVCWVIGWEIHSDEANRNFFGRLRR